MSLFCQGFTDPLRNDGGIVVYRKGHGALKTVRPRDEHSTPPFERVSGNPSFVPTFGLLAARDGGRFDALATMAGDSLDVEDRQRHTAQL
jgi:hypothetical protein